MDMYLLVGLIVVGIAMIIFERRSSTWQSIVGGLGINIIAAAVVLLIQAFYEIEFNIFPILIGGVGALALMLPFMILQQRRDREAMEKCYNENKKVQAQVMKIQAENENLLTSLELTRTKFEKGTSALTDSGITIYAKNYVNNFTATTEKEFGEFVRDFITKSPHGSTFKILGIDWTEIFGSAISATSERYFRLLAHPQTQFRVILLDPHSIVGAEKRRSEFELNVDGKPRYIPNHPDRIYGKILGSTQMIVDYHKSFPTQFQYRFIEELPTASFVANGTEIIFYLYTRSHKGWDSPVFVANKVKGGIYEYFEEYFDFLWKNPKHFVRESEWIEQKERLAPLIKEFEGLLKDGCSQGKHDHCPPEF